jgi:hypothetical protein
VWVKFKLKLTNWKLDRSDVDRARSHDGTCTDLSHAGVVIQLRMVALNIRNIHNSVSFAKNLRPIALASSRKTRYKTPT